METAQNAVNYVADTIKGATAGVSADANKEVAKDSNATVGTRIDAAKDFVTDKKDEKLNNASADVNREKLEQK